MNATIYSTDGSKHANFTEATPVPNTNDRDWDGTSNGMNDYYGEVDTDAETSVTFFDDTSYGGDSYTVGPGTNLSSLKAVFNHKVGSFQVYSTTPAPPSIPSTSNKAHSINITRITCEHTSDEAGADEVYLYIQADAGLAVRIPSKMATISMKSGDTMYVANNGSGMLNSYITVHFDYELLVNVWDQDVRIDPNFNTFLGCFEFVAAVGSNGPNYIVSDQDNSFTFVNHDNAKYTIWYNTSGCN